MISFLNTLMLIALINTQIGVCQMGFAMLLRKISTDGWQMNMKYDSRGLEIEREMSGEVKASYEYDSIGRIARHRVRSTYKGETRSMRYCFGINDRLFNIVNDLTKEITSFDYDSRGFLTFADYNNIEKLFRMPDAVGNLYKNKELSGRKYGDAGELLETDKVRFTYDADGNLTERIHPDGIRWHYNWAANGMLKSVIRPDKRDVAFEYDALGRRTAKTFDGQITRFVWDGNNPLHEWSYPLIERPQKATDEYGFITKVGTEPTENITTWIFEEGTFRPTAKITNDEKFSIVTDYLGTPADMYDKFGIKVWSATLDIYGKVRTFEGNKYAPEHTSCPFRYQGQYEDAETGLYYNRFRYYDPNMGMYLSQDPIGLAGGNPTLYGYVFDTNIGLDVFGLDCFKSKPKKKVGSASVGDSVRTPTTNPDDFVKVRGSSNMKNTYTDEIWSPSHTDHSHSGGEWKVGVGDRVPTPSHKVTTTLDGTIIKIDI